VQQRTSNCRQVQELIDAQAGYATPKIDIRGVVFQEGKILLVRELADGGWTLPGGWVDVNEPPFESGGARGMGRDRLPGASKQTAGGLRPQPARTHTLYFHTYKLYFRCELRAVTG
jgi:hypothetical protein